MTNEYRKSAFHPSALTALACAVALSACARPSSDQMGWARSAVQRNPALEVVGSDPQAHTLTVRVKSTGELRTVRLDELRAQLPDASGAAAPAVAADSAAPPANAAPAAAAPASAAAAAAPAPAVPAQASAAAAADASGGGPAASASVAQPPVVPAPSLASRTAHHGRVLASGPGYSITASNAAPPQGAPTPAVDAAAGALPVEHRHEPIICQGQRLLHIDRRNLEFDGDALAAQDGCELYITNSRIVADNGVGLSVRSALVHIENSSIEGGASAVQGSGNAEIYAQASVFKGVIRRGEGTAFHDQGGNVGD